MKLILLLIGIFSIIIGSGQGCSKVTLVPTEKVQFLSLRPEAELCVAPPKEVGKYSKVLFIIDVSGSNDTTDPSKMRRINAMRLFFNENRDNPFIEWGLQIFSGNTEGGSRHLINIAEGDVIRNFGNGASFEVALAEFQTIGDAGATPYVAALNKSRNAIETEMQISKTKGDDISAFHLLFISDGRPAPSSDITDAEIFTIIEQMLTASENKVRLSTVFYNVSGPDENAITRLKKMADLGNGRFQDASRGEEINIRDLIVSGVHLEPYFIKDLFVYNLNSSICDDGTMDTDSDADGLCDKDEDKYNSLFSKKIDENENYKGLRFSKVDRNSFDNKFNDLIMFKHIIEGESLPECQETEDNLSDHDGDLFNACEERFLQAKDPQGPTLAWTNDLIKQGGFASPTNFDSDGDGLLDSLEFLFFKTRGYSLSFNTINEKFNRRTFYDYFIQHQSFQKPNSSDPYNINVVWIRRNDFGLNCYRIEQENLPIYPALEYSFENQLKNSTIPIPPTTHFDIKPYLDHGRDENVILVYYLMTTHSNPDGKAIMRYSYQKRKPTKVNEVINYNDLKFEEVKAR